MNSLIYLIHKYHLKGCERMLGNRSLIQTLLSRSKHDPKRDLEVLNMYASAFKKHQEITYILDKESRIVRYNQNLNHLLGYHSDLSGKLGTYLSRNDHYKYLLMISKALNGHPVSLDLLVKTKQKDSLHLHFDCTPIEFEHSTIGACIVIKDCSKSKLSQENLHFNKIVQPPPKPTIRLSSWECDFTTGDIKGTKSFYNMFYVPKDTASRLNISDIYSLIHKDDYDEFIQLTYQSISSQDTFSKEFSINYSEQGKQYIRAVWRTFMSDDCHHKLIGIAENTTVQRELEDDLNFDISQLKNMHDHLNGVVWNLDVKTNRFLYVSGGIENIYGVSHQEFIENPNLWNDHVPDEDQDKIDEHYKKLQAGESVCYEHRIHHKNGNIIWVESECIPKLDKKGNLYQLFGCVRDITESKAMKAIIEYNATHDYLTGLHNRLHCYQTMEEWSKEPDRPFSFIYLDLKRLASINETLGFNVGDGILRQMAHRIQEVLSEEVYTARVGGGTFALMIRDFENEEDVYQVTQDILEKIEPSFQVSHFELIVEVRMGVSFFPNDSEHASKLLQLSGLALQRAKELDFSNMQVYHQSNDLFAQKRYELEKDLRHAIQNKELILYYQPKVRPANHTIAGLEALIRWEHPTWGIVTPNEFISLAEESYLISDLTVFVVEEACRQLHEWHEAGLPYRIISVNVSPSCFLDKNFMKAVKESLHSHNLNGKWLEVEVTETTLLKNHEQLIQCFNELRALGVKIALDDFGTGYSSLSYIKDFPIDTIKIDKSFIDQIGTTQKDTHTNKEEQLVSTVIFLAHAMKLTVVAEGVETRRQLTFLTQKDCHEIQGYLYSKPKPADEIFDLLESGKILPCPAPIKPDVEQREHYRVQFDSPVRTRMKLTQVRGKDVDVGFTEVLMKDLSIGGLKFVSALNIPVRPDVKIQFELSLLGQTLNVQGQIMWKNEMKYDTYDYGVQFSVSEVEEAALSKLVNKLSVITSKKLECPDTPFVYEDAYAHVHRMAHQ
ncbi:EAL domain-containing protein [Halobacillus litoralis]|uniref:EAL domain-containing protein n=1 Tax=Halobacillus litoralis TaxID=45668 RepID=UPI001CD5DD7F|nr:EAL domain-containing protein [Halobacillus litoralis]MCA0971697.1 EAL domain-containing protein [Halobacillus litoralis]